MFTALEEAYKPREFLNCCDVHKPSKNCCNIIT